ncbi:Molybdenum cofactor sulfurase [Planctomycetales bacterium 10988]|nr:Molybdenum cofactor sulfurase [Planctomycetales bacterium 10988]
MKLQGIVYYPLKSAQGLSVNRHPMVARGLIHDRQWMLVNSRGQFLTQRQFPAMARLNVQPAEDSLRCSYEGQPPCHIPLQLPEGELRPVRIWRDKTEAYGYPPAIDQWFQQALGTECHLVRQAEEVIRSIDRDYVLSERPVSFADGFPFLLTNQASLDALNDRLERSIPMSRFRTNLIVEGFPAFAEDDWKQVKIGPFLFEVAKPCARCKVINIDQQTGEPTGEPLPTLGTFRKQTGGIIFGQNLWSPATGVLEVGMPVTPIL